MINTQITTTGPVFTGQVRRDLRDELGDIKKDVADDGERMVEQRLGSVLKNPTGFYQSQIRTEQFTRDGDQMITDGGVVYGPWLESGAYSPPRRFRGYQTFRRVRDRLQKDAVVTARERIGRLIGRWNS